MNREERRQAAALQNGYHGDFQIDSGRRHARGLAVHLRALDRLQFAMHLVRYGVRVSRREREEGRRKPGCPGVKLWAAPREHPRTTGWSAGGDVRSGAA